ncbi:MAG: hypothetical protein ACPG5L_11390 [Vibrio gallaecicus]
MTIQINNKDCKGTITITDKSIGHGTINSYSWLLKSTSKSLILEIAEDPNITAQDLPLVGFGCGGWIFEQELTTPLQDALNKTQTIHNDKVHAQEVHTESDLIDEVLNTLNTGISLFKTNKLEYIPAVNSACSQ